MRLQDIMTADVATVAPGDTLQQVDRRNCLVGIVTVSDFLELMGNGTVRPVAPKATR